MKVYRSKYIKITGTSYEEIIRNARKQHQVIKKRTKRQPYIRSKYFNRDKIFVNLFWEHLMQKHRGEQQQRARFYLCAIDLLRNNTHDPRTIFTYGNLNIMLHRFIGISKDKEFLRTSKTKQKNWSQRFYICVSSKKA